MNGTLNLYGDLFAELNRLQDNFEQAFRPGSTGSIRALPRHTFPVINVGSTQDAIEVLALAPGVEPSALQITIDKGLLVIAGERNNDGPARGENTAAMPISGSREAFAALFNCPTMPMSARSMRSVVTACCG